MRGCVRPFVCPSVRMSVRPFVRMFVRPFLPSSKTANIRSEVFDVVIVVEFVIIVVVVICVLQPNPKKVFSPPLYLIINIFVFLIIKFSFFQGCVLVIKPGFRFSPRTKPKRFAGSCQTKEKSIITVFLVCTKHYHYVLYTAPRALFNLENNHSINSPIMRPPHIFPHHIFTYTIVLPQKE